MWVWLSVWVWLSAGKERLVFWGLGVLVFWGISAEKGGVGRQQGPAAGEEQKEKTWETPQE